MSPMPKIRDARRSGWKGSSASRPSPTPINLMGTPVTETIESAAPPLASPSSFDRTNPVIPIRSWNSAAVFTASCPAIASTTKRVSDGSMAFFTSSSSFISSVSIWKRPAVSTIAQEAFSSFARLRPFLATLVVSPLLPSS